MFNVRDGKLDIFGEETYPAMISESNGEFLLQYEMNTKEMMKEFKRSVAVECAKNGEFDPNADLFTLSFPEEVLTEIAIAQLSLVKKDLERVGGKSFKDPNYLSAYEFVQSEGFVHCCIVAGMDADDSANYAKYLARRYSKPYVIELNKALHMSPYLESRIVNTLEFAFELACELFEMRNDKTYELEDKLTTDTYWDYLHQKGVKADVVKRHLKHLFSVLR